MNLKNLMSPKRSSSREIVTAKQAFDAVNNAYSQRMSTRGLYNPASGAGTGMDKSSYFQFLPAWLNDTAMIENVTNQSWLAERFIDMPVDDMFAKPRVYVDDKFREEAIRLSIDKKIADTMKLARKYGTGLLWLVTNEEDSATPMNVKKIRKNNVVNCIVLDRHDVSIVSTTRNIMSPNFGKPEIYNLRVDGYGTVPVHHSRIYRVDGQESESSNGWKFYEKEWGVSELALVMQEVFNDVSVVGAITQLIQEASIPVHKVDGLSEIMCRGKLPDEQDVNDIMQQVSLNKSIYRTIFMDGEDQFDRTSVNFSNIPELMSQFEERFAMSSGVSTTRFLGKSPDGMNATGEGDQRNDSKSTRIRQTHTLDPFYKWIDPILARSAGTTVPSYEFPPLFEMSEKEVSDIDLSRGRTSKLMIDNGSWSPLEGKCYLETGRLPEGDLDADAERASSGTADPENKSNGDLVQTEKVANDS